MKQVLRLTWLEDRYCPVNAAGDFGNRDGYQYTTDSTDFIPFPDFMKSQYSAQALDKIIIGAAEGGGPRVQIRDAANNNAVLADFFAFEPSFRGGVQVATDGTHFVVGANLGGGPVVAVFDDLGHELARFFAYDPGFRGGVSVGINNGKIVTVPAYGGSPLVREFDFHGVQLDQEVYGSINDRSHYTMVAGGDVTWDGITDIVVVDNNAGSVNINNLVTCGTSGAQYVGYNADTFELGRGYVRARAVWGGFKSLELSNPTNGAAGNPNPPPTDGWRPGVFLGTLDPGVGGFTVTLGPTSDLRTLAGETLTVDGVGQGSQYAAMVNASGQEYVVTASHVVGLPSTGDPSQAHPIVGYGQPTIITPISIAPGATYTADAAAIPATNVNKAIRYNGVDYKIDGVRTPQPGDVIVAVGREFQFGVGIYQGVQATPLVVNWGLANNPTMVGAYVVGSTGEGPLGIPGYSGTAACILTQTGHFYLVGMLVAGDGNLTYVTPNAAVEAGLGLTAVV